MNRQELKRIGERLIEGQRLFKEEEKSSMNMIKEMNNLTLPSKEKEKYIQLCSKKQKDLIESSEKMNKAVNNYNKLKTNLELEESANYIHRDWKCCFPSRPQ